jgi:hypothetical protein
VEPAHDVAEVRFEHRACPGAVGRNQRYVHRLIITL